MPQDYNDWLAKVNTLTDTAISSDWRDPEYDAWLDETQSLADDALCAFLEGLYRQINQPSLIQRRTA